MNNALTQFKKQAGPLVEYVSESTTACLVTMVQGNLLALTVGHLVIATQTGVIAAAIASLTLMFARSRSRWLIAAVLGVTTGIVDFFVHDGKFGPVAMEAIVTGFAAAVLSYIMGSAIYVFRSRKFDQKRSTHGANDDESQ